MSIKNAPPMLQHLCMLLTLAGPEATIDWMNQFPEPVMKDEGPIKVGTVVRVPMDDGPPAHVTIEGWVEPSRFSPNVPRFRGKVQERDNESCVFTIEEIEDVDGSLKDLRWLQDRTLRRSRAMTNTDDMTEEDMLRELEERGLELDEGNLIGGYFIPDGTKRICEKGTSNVIAEGKTLRDAFEWLPTPHSSITW